MSPGSTATTSRADATEAPGAGGRVLGWLLVALLVALVVAAAVLLLRLLGTAPAAGASGPVDGTTPAVATARIESEELKAAALAAAGEQAADDATVVVGAGIISVTAEDARVLLFVDETAAGQVTLKRLVATLRHDGAWRITALDPV